MNNPVLAFAELVRGRFFTAFLAHLPDGALMLFPADTRQRLEGCAPDALVPGLRIEEDQQPCWEDAVAEWMLACDGQVELTPAPVMRMAMLNCADPGGGWPTDPTWECGHWPRSRAAAEPQAEAGLPPPARSTHAGTRRWAAAPGLRPALPR
jgi:hypothetical protein